MTIDFMALKPSPMEDVLWVQPETAQSATNMAAIGPRPRVKIRIPNFRFPRPAGFSRNRAK
jgi:hypothetical protein